MSIAHNVDDYSCLCKCVSIYFSEIHSNRVTAISLRNSEVKFCRLKYFILIRFILFVYSVQNIDCWNAGESQQSQESCCIKGSWRYFYPTAVVPNFLNALVAVSFRHATLKVENNLKESCTHHSFLDFQHKKHRWIDGYKELLNLSSFQMCVALFTHSFLNRLLTELKIKLVYSPFCEHCVRREREREREVANRLD